MPDSAEKAERIKYLATEADALQSNTGTVRKSVMLWLRNVRALSLKEIAERTGVTKSAVAQQVARNRKEGT